MKLWDEADNMERASVAASSIMALVITGVFFLLLAGCPKPEPTPTPPPPGPTPTPIVDACGKQPDSSFKTVSTLEAYNELFLVQSEGMLGVVCGRPSTESIGKLAAELASRGICSGPWKDGILIKRPDGYWEQWNVVEPGSGCWGNAYVATWRPPSLECGQ